MHTQNFHCADHSRLRASEISILVGYGVMENYSISNAQVVDSCARPHTVLPVKVKRMKDTVCFALYICFRISLLHGITRQRRTLL